MATLGCSLPTSGDLPARLGLSAMARAAEEAGAESLWVGDHIVWPRTYRSPYPYLPSGRPPRLKDDTPIFEALTAMSWAAASTSKARIGSSVLVLPQRDPVLVAKAVASMDVLSGGRVSLGIGAGWLREELEALGWDWGSRGRRLEEAVTLLRACWSGSPEAFDGDFFTLPDGLSCYPTPVGSGGVPILIGGMTDIALSRAARIGDGWMALAVLASFGEAELAERFATFREHALSCRGTPLRTVVRVVGPAAADGEHAARLRTLEAIGFDELIVEVDWSDLDSARWSIAGLRAALADG